MPKYHSRPPAYTLILALVALAGDGCAKAPSAHPWIPSRYAAVGDSFTIGTGSPPDRSFPAELVSRWPRATLHNLGVNGFTTSDVIDRELPHLPSLHPDFATLAIGANDIVRGIDRETYRANLRTIFSAIGQSVLRCHVIALPQPDWSLSPVARSFGSPEMIGAKIRDFNAILREEATSHGARYIDLFPLMRQQADARMLAPDGLHPSAESYQAWARLIAATLDTEPLPDACP